MIRLMSNVGIGVPSTTYVNVPTDTSAYVEQTTRQFSEWFGGATVDPKDGAYIAKDGQLIMEPIFWVISFCTTQQLEEYLPQAVVLAQTICRELHQESVAMIINYEMFLVSAA